MYGIRKMWRALHREGIDIGREHTAPPHAPCRSYWQRQRWCSDYDPQTYRSGYTSRLGGARVQSP
ncbi:hypothetical protein [Corynebacterium diphtheriae]|uniref:hypothetical protein n=1 Tax=Corynebacterium diphtheriae TaxID=1717 RepID=UPI0039BF51DB